MEFEVEDGVTKLRPVLPHVNPLDRFIGIAPAFKSMAEINAWVREMRGHDEQG